MLIRFVRENQTRLGGAVLELYHERGAAAVSYTQLGGAHPFAMLDYSIVHNGEISSYDANRRFIEMFGYQCTRCV